VARRRDTGAHCDNTPLLLALGWISFGGVVAALGDVMISELMAINNTRLRGWDLFGLDQNLH